jgi:fructosamine-3-kinase
MDMWKQIAIAITEATGQKLLNVSYRSQSGGCINQSFVLSDISSNGTTNFFVKINQANYLDMFVAEAIALQQIVATNTINAPQPICWGIAANSAYLVLENLALGGRQDWQAMGQQLAAMHRIVSDRGFGWERNNTIGSTPQPNPWTPDWLEFWIEHRLGFQMRLARRKGWRSPLTDAEFYRQLPALFTHYQPQPALVHGDLWGGNVGFVDGRPIIYDPALYFGDREVDLAMTELFGGFPQQFYQAYNASYPLDRGYGQRKKLYNLYHILNHFNLFGGSYGSQASRMIADIAAL